ncbi:MAG: polysaccharide biosynthesis C-terminal domain-containing protein, partial [Rhodobacteraceae bacterium]|nr:polysaccharide biosynthesis C-terminal domain-containing protein [Paracoccaceae bacterium]
FWVSRLGDERLMAALGFAWTVQFFIISSGIGLAIAATTLVSRALGEGAKARARSHATGAMMLTFLIQGGIAAAVAIWRDEALALAGAEGETLALAGRFLMITLPSMPLLALGMTGGAILRALGDAWRAMSVTLGAGVVAACLDPLFIFTFGLGIDGAAWVMVIARSCVGALSLWYLLGVHDMLARPRMAETRAMLRPFAAIAAPATLTQMSTPFGNALLTALIAGFGDGAVAGWAVVSRLTVLAFGGIYALSGAIGGIIGQNYGAGLMPRVRSTFRDALIFCAVYTVGAWALLFAGRGLVVDLFRLGPEGAAVVDAFVGLAAGGFVFGGALFVANAAFNTLGRPLWSTGFNWSRDGIVLFPLAWAMAQALDAPGVIYGQALASVAVGAAAAWTGWRFVRALQPRARTDARQGALETAPDPLHLASEPTS